MSELSLDRAISDHLALCRRNRRLERRVPLDSYRDQVGGGLIEGFLSDALPKDEPETEAVVNTRQEQWLEPGSFWDTSRERPLPAFNWNDG